MKMRKPRLRKSRIKPTDKSFVVELVFPYNVAKTPLDLAREVSSFVATTHPVTGFAYRQGR
jgi:hypothetical protein